MGRKPVQLKGNRYGMLEVLEEGPKIKGKRTWNCICDCGNTSIVQTSNLTSGKTQTCGCSRFWKGEKSHGIKHGGSRTYIYNLWMNIKQRCLNSNCRDYQYYGAKGKTIYSPWIDDFESFRDYILNNLGERPAKTYTLDRIDNEGNYEPGNIRWDTKKVQSTNQGPKRSNTSGCKGVCFCNTRNKWRAFIGIDNKQKSLGYYLTFEEAVKARKEGEKMLEAKPPQKVS